MPVQMCPICFPAACPCTGTQPAAKIKLYPWSTCQVLPYVGFAVVGGVCTWIWRAEGYPYLTLYVFFDPTSGQWGSRIDNTAPASGTDETFGEREIVQGGPLVTGDTWDGSIFPFAQRVPDPQPWLYGDGTHGTPVTTPDPANGLNPIPGSIRCVEGFLTSYSDDAASTPGAYTLGSGAWMGTRYEYYAYSSVTLNANGDGSDATCP